MMKAKNNKAAIRFLKNKALEARKNFMLPFYLTKLIYALKGDETVRYVNLLKEFTERLLRLKGFYQKYADEEQRATRYIRAELAVHGFFKD